MSLSYSRDRRGGEGKILKAKSQSATQAETKDNIGRRCEQEVHLVHATKVIGARMMHHVVASSLLITRCGGGWQGGGRVLCLVSFRNQV